MNLLMAAVAVFTVTSSDIHDPRNAIRLFSDKKSCVLKEERAEKKTVSHILKVSACSKFFSSHHFVFENKPKPQMISASSPTIELTTIYRGKAQKQLVVMFNSTTCDANDKCETPKLTPQQELAFDLQKLVP